MGFDEDDIGCDLLLLALLLFDAEVADSEGGFSFKPSSIPNHFFVTFLAGLSAGVFALVSPLVETVLLLGSNPQDFFGFTALEFTVSPELYCIDELTALFEVVTAGF